MDNSAEYPSSSHARGAMLDHGCAMIQGKDSGTILAVPAIMVATVSRIGTYLPKSRVDSTLCQPQMIEAAIMSKSPCHDPRNETPCDPYATIPATPASDMMIPASTLRLKRSRPIATPMRKANTG